jgi:hypothetical protein
VTCGEHLDSSFAGGHTRDHDQAARKGYCASAFLASRGTGHAGYTEVPLLIFRHWVARNYDIAHATPELIREIEVSFLETYHAASPLKRSEALELLNVYGEHFYKTASPEERAVMAVATGHTPLEYEIMGEGFSLRELMLK